MKKDDFIKNNIMDELTFDFDHILKPSELADEVKYF